MAKPATRKGAAAPAKTTASDWESVEREYRANVLSVRVIAKRHGIPESSIRKRAKQGNWQRDLSQQVNDAVRSKLLRQTDGDEPAIIEAAANMVVTVIETHRKDIGDGRKIVTMLFDQLNEAALNREAIADDIEDETREDKTAERRNRMKRAISLPAHAATMRDLAQALRHVVLLERQAFSIDDKPIEEPERNDQLTATIAEKIKANLNAIAAG